MRKIEELTLYTIQQQRELEELRRENEMGCVLMQEVERLKEIVENRIQ